MVDVYQARFNALSRFAPQMVSDEGQRVCRLMGGLRFPIQNRLVPLRLKSFDEALSTAQLIKQDLEDYRQDEGDSRGKGKAVSSRSQPGRTEHKGKRAAYDGRTQSSLACVRY